MEQFGKDINASTMGSKPYPLGVINNELFSVLMKILTVWNFGNGRHIKWHNIGKGHRPGILGSDPSTDGSSMELFTLGPMMVTDRIMENRRYCKWYYHGQRY